MYTLMIINEINVMHLKWRICSRLWELFASLAYYFF